MGRRGCLGRLFWLPMALLGGQRSRPALPQRGLDPAEREALQAARQAAAAISQRLLATGRDVDPMVLDQVGGSAQALGDAVDRMGQQLAEARDWLSRNDPDRLNRELTELELTDGAGVGARATAMRLLRDKARFRRSHVDQIIVDLFARDCVLSDVRALQRVPVYNTVQSLRQPWTLGAANSARAGGAGRNAGANELMPHTTCLLYTSPSPRD